MAHLIKNLTTGVVSGVTAEQHAYLATLKEYEDVTPSGGGAGKAAQAEPKRTTKKRTTKKKAASK